MRSWRCRPPFAAEADPNRYVPVLAASGINTVISLTYGRASRYLDAVVLSALHAALLDPDKGLFGVNAVGIGQVFYDSQIYAACLAVPGIVAVEDLLVRVGNQLRLLAKGRPVRRGRLPPVARRSVHRPTLRSRRGLLHLGSRRRQSSCC